MTLTTDVVGTDGVYLYLLHKFSKINFTYGIISGPWRDDTFKKPEVKNLGESVPLTGELGLRLLTADITKHNVFYSPKCSLSRSLFL
jgi:hypothetical protein